MEGGKKDGKERGGEEAISGRPKTHELYILYVVN